MLNKIREIIKYILSKILNRNNSNKLKGKVKWFNKDKGFGFIESNGKDYFAHYSEINRKGFKTLKEGASVSFRPGQGVKGPQAESIEII